jgi:hypothetical protein
VVAAERPEAGAVVAAVDTAVAGKPAADRWAADTVAADRAAAVAVEGMAAVGTPAVDRPVADTPSAEVVADKAAGIGDTGDMAAAAGKVAGQPAAELDKRVAAAGLAVGVAAL